MRGPTIIFVIDGTDRYFVFWRARYLLLSSGNLKGAILEDANRHDLRLQDTDVDLLKDFVDMTDEAPPPAVVNGEPTAPFEVQAPGVRLRRRPNGLGRKTSEAKRMFCRDHWRVFDAGEFYLEGAGRGRMRMARSWKLCQIPIQKLYEYPPKMKEELLGISEIKDRR